MLSAALVEGGALTLFRLASGCVSRMRNRLLYQGKYRRNVWHLLVSLSAKKGIKEHWVGVDPGQHG
jgi:hypothetical protein